MRGHLGPSQLEREDRRSAYLARLQERLARVAEDEEYARLRARATAPFDYDRGYERLYADLQQEHDSRHPGFSVKV